MLKAKDSRSCCLPSHAGWSERPKEVLLLQEPGNAEPEMAKSQPQQLNL